MTYDEWCTAHQVSVEVIKDHGTQVNDPGWVHHFYELRLHNNGRTLDVSWRQGVGVKTSPTDVPGQVFQSLAFDASMGEEPFEDFCGDCGYDTDSRKAYAIWLECQALSLKLATWMGDDMIDLPYLSED